MTKEIKSDAVDAILAQWARERPDLDCSPMGIIGRLKRCETLLQRQLNPTFNQFSMSSWEFDMLATLRRSGAPYCLAPTELFSTLMVTSGTMTHRLQRLEANGWISRLSNPDDARSLLVQLSPSGLDLINRAVKAHVDNEHRILKKLNATDKKILSTALSNLLVILEDNTEP